MSACLIPAFRPVIAPLRRLIHALPGRRRVRRRRPWRPLGLLRLAGRALGAALCLLAALGLPPATAADAPRPAPAAYVISAGDTLGVVTWEEEEFTLDCQVNSVGTISLPMVGDVPAAGLTCQELQQELQRRLSRYLVEPQVTVTVKQYSALGASVFVLGEVKAPGMYPLPAGAKLLQALAAAGGATGNASDEVTVVKAGSGEFRAVSLQASALMPSPEDVLAPGDIVLVNRMREADQPGRYTVLGEVPSPGMFDLPVKSTVRVLDAMEKAGLLQASTVSGDQSRRTLLESLPRTADLEHALLSRGDVVVPLDLKALLEGDASQNLILQADDVLTVPRRALVTVSAIGEVRTPGKQLLPLGATVLDLVGAAGGVTQGARPAKATLIRVADGRPTPLEVDLARLLTRPEPAQNLQLQDGDVLFVPAQGRRDDGLLKYLMYLPYWLLY
jgi:polysaccharide export outer membrane protein